MPGAVVSLCRSIFLRGRLRIQADRANGFERMRLVFNGNTPFDASRSRMVQPRIQSLSLLPFRCVSLVALHSIMTFGPSPVMVESSDGTVSLDVQTDRATVWLSLNQISSLFDRDKSTISRHIKNVYEERELDESSTVALFATVQA